MTPAQCKAARQLLGWSTRKLAELSSAAPATVQKFEKGERSTHPLIVQKMRETLENAGVEFVPSSSADDAHARVRAIELTDGSAVRLRETR